MTTSKAIAFFGAWALLWCGIVVLIFTCGCSSPVYDCDDWAQVERDRLEAHGVPISDLRLVLGTLGGERHMWLERLWRGSWVPITFEGVGPTESFRGNVVYDDGSGYDRRGWRP